MKEEHTRECDVNRFGNVTTFRNTLDAYGTCCKPLCRKLGLPGTAFDILMFLANNPEYYTAKDVCRYRGFKNNIVSMHVSRLVEEGYLTRSAVQGDRRKVRLLITEKAIPVIEQGREVQLAFKREILNGLTEEELAVFNHCIQVIAGNANRMNRKNSREEKTEC